MLGISGIAQAEGNNLYSLGAVAYQSYTRDLQTGVVTELGTLVNFPFDQCYGLTYDSRHNVFYVNGFSPVSGKGQGLVAIDPQTLQCTVVGPAVGAPRWLIIVAPV